MDRTLFLVCMLLGLGTAAAITVSFDKRHVEYLAMTYNEDLEPTDFRYPSREAHKVAVDKKRKLLYSVGPQRFSVFKIFRNNTLKLLHTETVTDIIYESVQTCNGFVTVTARTSPIDELTNRLLVFSGYKKRFMGNMPKPSNIQVGTWPVDHVVTRNCRKVIVASQESGTIEVITFRGSMFRNPKVKTLGFGAFNNIDDEARLEEEWFVVDPSEDFDVAIKPKWLCLNKKETKIYASLTDNNGIAVVDLKPTQERVEQLIGLGLKDWSEDGSTSGLDGIDDDVAHVVNAPIFSTYSPAQISCQTIGKQECIFVAGGRTDLRFAVKNLGLDPVDFDDAFKAQYGDLRVFSLPRTDTDGDAFIELVVTSGTRDFSLFCGNPLSLVTDTGSDLELRTMDSPLFNTWPTSDRTLEESFEFWSEFSGPEPISVITKKVCGGRYIVMIGSTRRPGHLYIYTLDTKNIQAGFQFQDMIDGYEREDSSFTDTQLYNMRLISLRDVEGLSFVTGVRPGGRLVFAASARLTGTVDLFDIRVDCKAGTILN